MAAPDKVACGGCGVPLPPNAPSGICPSCLIGQGAALASVSHSPGTGGFITPTTEELALLFPEFTIVKLLGRGGMGVVYQAEQPALERTVAIKILPPETGGGDGELAERFRREAAALARLDHPHIVKIYDFGERGGFAYFVMECVDGTDLAQRMRTGQLPRAEALRIAGDLCDALHFSHGKGVVHRDVKPSNILIGFDGTVKIADFGLAKLVHPGDAGLDLTLTNAALGTPRYMAPEQLAGARDTDHRVDIYALGVVLYELLTGQFPAGKLGPPSENNPEVHPLFDDVVLRALSQEPETRYSDASEVKTDLLDASEGKGLTRHQKARRSSRKKLLTSIGAAAVGAGATLFSVTGGDETAPPPALPGRATYTLLTGSGIAAPPLRRASATGISSSATPFAIALDPLSGVVGWGDDRFGQSSPPQIKATAVAVAQGPSGGHSIALGDDGRVTGWGDDTYGQATPPADLENVVQIAAGQFHSLALTASGEVIAWGRIPAPPQGSGPARAVASGADFCIALASENIVSWGEIGPFPEDDTNIIAISAGDTHALALHGDGSVTAWGGNSDNQCEVPVGLPPAAQVVAGGNGSAIIASDGTVVAWGDAPTADAFAGHRVYQLSLGSRKVWCALVE